MGEVAKNAQRSEKRVIFFVFVLVIIMLVFIITIKETLEDRSIFRNQADLIKRSIYVEDN